MEQGFGQFCPLALASDVLTQRWTLLILRELSNGAARFNDIKRGVPRISATLLKQRLNALERAEIVEHTPTAAADAFQYRLTPAGLELKPILAGISTWGQRWARDIGDDDLDPEWLVWAMHRRLDTAQMPAGRTVIQIVFSGVPADRRNFWLVHEGGKVDVCLKPPGYDVDVLARASVRVMVEVWRGIRSLPDELHAGSIQLEGDQDLCRQFPGWLLLSVYAPVKRQLRKGDTA